MAQHVAASHRDIGSFDCVIGGAPKSLASLVPTGFVAFAPKGSSAGHYILRVLQNEELVATWLLVKRHRKSYVEVGLECLHASEGFRNLAYIISASDDYGTTVTMTTTSTTRRIRDNELKGVVLCDTLAFGMRMFQVDVNYHASIQLQVRFQNEEAARKRPRIEISSNDADDEDDDDEDAEIDD
jgi:hypothetical protein